MQCNIPNALKLLDSFSVESPSRSRIDKVETPRPCYNGLWDLGPGLIVFRPTIVLLGVVPDYGEQAHMRFRPCSEKPKVITYCIHLSKDGRNQKKAPLNPFLFLLKFDSSLNIPQNLEMNSYEEISDSPISTSWIENLALDELNMDESGVVSLDEHLDPSNFLEESSINFMNSLRDRFEIYITKFNEYRGHSQSSSLIKTFKISNTVNDFMLFRNSLRMIFGRKANDLISIGFLSNGKEFFSPRLNNQDSLRGETHEIRAHVGPFNNISWRFGGEIVDLDALVRHYLSEFIRLSSR